MFHKIILLTCLCSAFFTPQTFAAEKPKLLGIDVSLYQSTVDWKRVKKDGVAFAIVRATMGEDKVDDDFKNNWKECKQDDLIRGAYHFFHGGQDAKKQANHFLKTVHLEKGDLPLIVDVERTKENQSVPKEILVTRLKTFVAIVYKKTGLRPIIYTGPTFWNTYINEQFNEHPLWVAEYGVDQPRPTNGWSNWTFWQHTESGTMPGIKGTVDQNWFQGTREDLKAMTKSN